MRAELGVQLQVSCGRQTPNEACPEGAGQVAPGEEGSLRAWQRRDGRVCIGCSVPR